MAVDQNFGFWVTVPQGNGYDRKLFEQRVIDDLRKVGQPFVPALAKVLRGEVGEDGKVAKWQDKQPTTDKSFGVEIQVRGEWYDEIYRKVGAAKKMLTDRYGLVIEPAQIGHNQDFSRTFVVRQEKNP
ncbi:MAG: hypothetical protein WAV41_04170 [Microgenomates group bacterium]